MYTHNPSLTPIKLPGVMLLITIFLLNYSGMLYAKEIQTNVKTLLINGYNMSYIERGSGTPLILVHGSLSDYRTWLPLLKEFSETNRTISISLRHYYPEQWNGKGDDLSLQQHANDMATFIQALNIGPVNLLGHSRGGAVSLLMASQHPELISRLILADPAPLTTMLAKRADIQAAMNIRKDKLHDMMKYYQHGNTDGGLQTFVHYIAGPGAWKNTSEARRNVLRSNTWTLTSLLRDIETPFNCDNAAKITAPVLLITGERSAPLYHYMHSALQPCLKQASKATIADAGHMMFQANPTAFLFEVQDFISPQ